MLHKILFVCCMVFWPHIAHAALKLTIYPSGYITSIDNQLEAQKEVNATPGNASLTDKKEWDNQRATSVKDITDYIPGVIAQPRNGAESSRLSIRGSGLANLFQGRGLLVLQDGIPINTADGGFEFPVIDPWLIDYAQIFPGANALAYGASSFGGAINFITPTGGTENTYQLRGEGGSFGTAHGLVSAGKEWQGGDAFAASTGFSQEGFREQSEQNTIRLNTNWGWQPSNHFSNRVYLSHTHTNAEIPGAISRAQVKRDPTMANANNMFGDYQRNLNITRIANKTAWTEGDNRLDTTVFYTYRSLDNPVTTYEYQHNNDGGISARYSHHFGKSAWHIGTNHYYGTAAEIRYRNMRGAPGALILERNLYALTSELYGQLEQHLTGKFYGIAGVQASYAMRDVHEISPSILAQNKDYSGLNPRLGMRYDITRTDQIFANLSRSFEPPSWGELSGGNDPGFKPLKSQRATTAEIGTRARLRGLHLQAAYYHSWLQGEFVNYRSADGSTNTINAHRSQSDGVELGVNGDVVEDIWKKSDALVLRAAYNFNHFRLEDDPLYGNNTLPGIPRHYLRGEILYRHPSGISFGPNVEWSPHRAPIDLTNTLYAPSYNIYGLRAFWESADKRVNIYADGRNLFDRHYIATYNVQPDTEGQDGNYFYPGDGRAAYMGVRWSL